jgi:predicted secreted protein
MATNGYVLGHNLRVYVGSAGVGNATSCSISYDVDSKELSDKDVDPGSTAPGAVALTLGKKRATISSQGYVVEANGGTAKVGGYRDLLDACHAGTLITWKYTTDVTGDTVISGSGYITKFSSAGDDGSEATYSIEIKSTGTITIADKA